MNAPFRLPSHLAMKAATVEEAFLKLFELRDTIERTLHEMVGFLDVLDGDADIEATSIETHGAGFIASGADDVEDGHDLEWDPAENGIADHDALAEYRGGVS